MIENGTFTKNLMQMHQFMIPLLRWIISSNMTYLKPCSSIDIPNVTLPEKFKEIFVMKTSILTKEKIFNTKYMSTGAAYGDGIYLASDINTASSYSSRKGQWKNSVYGTMSLLALCEAATVPELANKTGYIYTLTDEDALITRYLIVY